jgi:hypothetical protein
MSWVIDLSHFIDKTGNLPIGLPAPARRLAAQLTAIVAAATAGGANEQATRRIKCRRRPGRQACSGVIEYRLWADERITWQCPPCGDSGVISNWQSTTWDRRLAKPVH